VKPEVRFDTWWMETVPAGSITSDLQSDGCSGRYFCAAITDFCTDSSPFWIGPITPF
jgi:hypothetical protein